MTAMIDAHYGVQENRVKISKDQLEYLNANRGIVDEYIQTHEDISGRVANGAVTTAVFSWSAGTRVLVRMCKSPTHNPQGVLVHDWSDLLQYVEYMNGAPPVFK